MHNPLGEENSCTTELIIANGCVYIRNCLYSWYFASGIFLVNGDTYMYTYLLENLSSTNTIQTYDILCTTSLM